MCSSKTLPPAAGVTVYEEYVGVAVQVPLYVPAETAAVLLEYSETIVDNKVL